MNKLVHYILIAIMFNWNIAVFAEEENKGCKWEVVEETDTYIQESCVGGEDGSFQARIRSKPVDGSIVIVEAPKKNKKKANPIQEFKDKVEEAPKIVEKVEKIEKIEKEVIVTEKKVQELKQEKNVTEKVEETVAEVIKVAPADKVGLSSGCSSALVFSASVSESPSFFCSSTYAFSSSCALLYLPASSCS